MQWLVIILGFIILILVSDLVYKFLKRKPAIEDAGNSKDKEEQFARNCQSFSLSNRETEIARLILQGWTYKAVAGHLFISEKTVDSHMQNIYAKTGVRNKLALMSLLYQ